RAGFPQLVTTGQGENLRPFRHAISLTACNVAEPTNSGRGESSAASRPARALGPRGRRAREDSRARPPRAALRLFARLFVNAQPIELPWRAVPLRSAFWLAARLGWLIRGRVLPSIVQPEAVPYARREVQGA